MVNLYRAHRLPLIVVDDAVDWFSSGNRAFFLIWIAQRGHCNNADIARYSQCFLCIFFVEVHACILLCLNRREKEGWVWG